MKKSVLILLINICLSSLLYSQSDFTPGYLLKIEGDTIFGFLKSNTNIKNTKYCEFKKDEKDTVIRQFTSNQLGGYRFINGKNYISREIKIGNVKKRMFIEFLVEGRVNLYFYQDNVGNHYLLDKTGLPMTEISRFDKFVEQNDSVFQRDVLIKRGVVEYYLRECPQLFPEIERIKNGSHENLIALLKKYHSLTCPDEKCLIYTKEIPKLKIYLQPTIDLYNAVSMIPFNGDSKSSIASFKTLTFGVLANFSMPVVNEKIYFRSGFILSRVLASGFVPLSTSAVSSAYNLFKVPLLFQYMDDRKIFTPTFGVGLDVMSSSYIPFEVLPVLNVGLNAKIANQFYVSLFTDVEAFSTQEGILLTHSLKFSVVFKL